MIKDTANDLVTSNNCYVAATGITNGDLLRRVRYSKDKVLTQSMVMRSKSGTIRVVDSEHQAHNMSVSIDQVSPLRYGLVPLALPCSETSRSATKR